jgi:hypothetical protein
MVLRFIARNMGLVKSGLASRRIIGLAKRGAVASFSIVTVTAILLGVRHLGGLQSLELIAFDYLVRLRSPKTTPDPRILVITITEQARHPIAEKVALLRPSERSTLKKSTIPTTSGYWSGLVSRYSYRTRSHRDEVIGAEYLTSDC